VVAGLVEINLPSGRVLAALAPLIVLALGVVVYSLIDLVRAEQVAYLPKAVWAVIILVVSVPVGAIAYLVFGRERRGEGHRA
jgi:hypothetical protein